MRLKQLLISFAQLSLITTGIIILVDRPYTTWSQFLFHILGIAMLFSGLDWRYRSREEEIE